MKPITTSVKIMSILMLVALVLGGTGNLPVRAAQIGPETASPAGLSAEDWAQIQSLLGAGLPDQRAYLKASNTEANDFFGLSVAISGDTVVVGAQYESSNATGVNGNQSDNSASSSGAAYVFTRSGTTWSQQAYLKASNTGAGDEFGSSVAISGDTLVVGAYRESSNATGVNGDQTNNSASSSGAAYVFVRSGTTWSQQAYLKAYNTGAGDWFGLRASISGDTMVVGARHEDSNATGVDGNQSDDSASESGAAYVFTRSGTTWSQQAYLKASNTGVGDYFGYSVAISGDTLVVGAYGESSNATGVNGNQADNSASDSGAAYVFTRSGTTWSQQAYLKASNTDKYDRFGTSVAISEETIVVGGYDEDSNATGVNGNQNDNSASMAGAAYVFTRSGTTWSQQAYLKASNTDAYDHFGDSVAISEDTVVVGAQYESSNATGVNGNQSDNSAADSGAAYIFTRSGTTWSQQAYLKASNTGAGDHFGLSIAISEDTVVVGAPYESSNATGVNGNQNDNSAPAAGAAYVFTPPNSAPTDISISKSSVYENKPVGTVVGILTTTDPDVWDTHTYAFACSAPGADDTSFLIVGNSLKTNAVFDYETKNSYAICIQTTDEHGGIFDKNFTIHVTHEILTTTFRSVGSYDGDILETTETSTIGGTVDSASTTFRLGDEVGDKQYRAVLSFNTATLPDTAVITKVTLKIKRPTTGYLVGTNPFTWGTGLKADVCKTFFGTSAALQLGDFNFNNATNCKLLVGAFGNTPVASWFSANILGTAFTRINKTGTTQFRLRFAKDDNDDNASDYMKFYSGNFATATSRPTLVIEYYIP